MTHPMKAEEVIARAVCCPRGCRLSPNQSGECIAYQCGEAAGAALTALKAAGMAVVPVEAIKPFRDLAKLREFSAAFADDSFTINLGLMNGNVTQSIIRDRLKVGHLRALTAAEE